MNNMEYMEYLKSEKWKEIARERLLIDGGRCQMCGASGTMGNPLEVHHISYKHIGNEENRKYEDLVTVCHCCHKSIHRMMNRVTSPSGRRGWKDSALIPNVQALNFDNEADHIEFMVTEKER